MAKASFASKDAYEPKLGFQEGNFGISNAVSAVFQYPPSRETGEQQAPFLAAVLTVQKLDEQGNATDDEPLEKVLRVEKDLTKMRPGRASSREDNDPEDLGDELETEGNVFFVEEGAKINKNTTFATFMASLEEKGFKSEILGAGYLPDLIGLKAHAVIKKAEKRSINGRDVEPSYFVVDKILARPYETAATPPAKKGPVSVKAAKPIAKPAESAEPVAATPAAAAPVLVNGHAATNAAATHADDADAAATAILAELVAELDGSEPRDEKKLFAMAYSRLVRDKARDKKLDKSISELFKSQEWLILKSGELQSFSYEDGLFTFGSATLTAA